VGCPPVAAVGRPIGVCVCVVCMPGSISGQACVTNQPWACQKGRDHGDHSHASATMHSVLEPANRLHRSVSVVPRNQFRMNSSLLLISV
jgi:hypothetical protein